jgi:addiction module RelE/StbE family toxin
MALRVRKILWQKQAIINLNDAREYIQAHNPEAAQSIIDRIEKVINQLQSFPMSGRPGRRTNTRELVVTRTPFLVVYRVSEDFVEILSLFHTSKQWPD